jgi:lactate dehydrogenase-like 2-hydroxyacid dehydrogenase
VARKAKAFNMKVVYYQRTRLGEATEMALDATYCASLTELLSKADIISLHCPLNADTTGMISYQQFDVMKDGVFLVNTCRGPVINEAALVGALERGKVARAGLDVFDNEPNIK